MSDGEAAADTRHGKNERAVLEVGALKDVCLLVSVPDQYSHTPEGEFVGKPRLKAPSPEGYDYVVHIEGDCDFGRGSKIMASEREAWWVELRGTPEVAGQDITIVCDGEEVARFANFGPDSWFRDRITGDELRIEAAE